ncbi:DUF1330 domain-containing protein [Chloroflexota bacterium]
MSAYLITRVKITDPVEFKKYMKAFLAQLESFPGKTVAAVDDVDVLEGEWPEGRTVIMEFPSKEKALEWYESREYQENAQIRLRSSEGTMILFEGLS